MPWAPSNAGDSERPGRDLEPPWLADPSADLAGLDLDPPAAVLAALHQRTGVPAGELRRMLLILQALLRDPGRELAYGPPIWAGLDLRASLRVVNRFTA
jgi:hypothetical protein